MPEDLSGFVQHTHMGRKGVSGRLSKLFAFAQSFLGLTLGQGISQAVGCSLKVLD